MEDRIIKSQVSNCCGADILGEESDGIGMCSECKEWSEVETEYMEESLGELRVQLDNGKTDVISNILSREGYNTLINSIQSKENKETMLEEGINKLKE